jgi:hypothetical protein
MAATLMPMLTSRADQRKTGAASKSGSADFWSFTRAARRMKFAMLALEFCKFTISGLERGKLEEKAHTEHQGQRYHRCRALAYCLLHGLSA